MGLQIGVRNILLHVVGSVLEQALLAIVGGRELLEWSCLLNEPSSGLKEIQSLPWLETKDHNQGNGKVSPRVEFL